MKKTMLGLAALLSACGARTEIVQRPSDEVVIRVRVRDDLRPGTAPTQEEQAPPRCEGPGPEGQPTSSLTVGHAHACVALGNGTVRCWGSNYASQLGDGTTQASSSPVAVLGGMAFQSFDVGGRHNCGVADTGVAFCWGSNSEGRLGNGGNAPSYQPYPVVVD